MATLLGSRTKPTYGQVWFGSNTLNQEAFSLLLPAGGPWQIVQVGFWMAGKDAAVTTYGVVWDTSDAILGQSNPFTAAGLSFGLGQSIEYVVNINNPPVVNGNTTVRVGWSRNPSGAHQYGIFNGGQGHLQDTATGSYPQALTGLQVDGNDIGAYLYYEAANDLPTAPTLTSPADGATVADTTPELIFTHNDPNLDACASYDIQIDATTGLGVVPDWTSLAWEVVNGTTGISGTTITRSSLNVLTRGQWYAWRARTADAVGDGPWSSPRYFKINLAPTAPTLTSPADGATLTDTTPTLVFNHNDPESDAITSYDIQVDTTTGQGVVPDWATLAWEVINGTTGISGTTVTRDVVTVLTAGQWYAWRARTADSLGDGAWSGPRYFKINQRPSGPTLTSPNDGTTVEDTTPDLIFTHVDADNDACASYDIQVDTTTAYGVVPDWATLAWEVIDGTTGITDTTVTRTTGTLSTPQWYAWRARTADAGGDGAWSVTRWFRVSAAVNQIPTAPTLTGPANNSSLSDTTPTLLFTHNDPNGDACASYDIQVDVTSGHGVEPDWASLAWEAVSATSGISGTSITAEVGSALTLNNWYAWRARTADAESDGPWSVTRYFRIATATSPNAYSTATPSPKYTILIRSFANLSDFGPGPVKAVIDKFHFLAFGDYVNEVGEAYFTIAQKDPKAALLRSIVENGAIMQVLRDGFLVWAGWLSEVDEGPIDAIFYAYSYLSGLFKLHTDWAAEWTNKQLDFIIAENWARAQTLPQSRMGWMTTGTIEAPVTTSGGATPYVQGLYQAYNKRILFVMKEIAAAAMSDTTNRVVVEITQDGEFNFWKNRGELLTGEKWLWGDPRILSYRRFRRPLEHANTLIAVGATPRSVIARFTAEDTVNRAAVGRAEETIYFPWIRDEGELARVAKLRLARAIRLDADLGLTFAPRALTPFKAPNQSYKLTDSVLVTIQNGATSIAAQEKMILGQQVLVLQGEEFVRPLLGDRL